MPLPILPAAILAAAGLIFSGTTAQAEEAKPPAPAEPGTAPALPDAAAAQEALETAFVQTLAGVLFKGQWCQTAEGKLGEARPEQYEIAGVMKTGGDRWIINARIEYGKINLVAPVPVQVKWAGDTPVIIVDKFTMPGAGTYSARVMIYENTYSGTWTAGDHGGLLHGLIVKKP